MPKPDAVSTAVDTNTGSTVSATPNVVTIFGLSFDTSDPMTFIIFWAILVALFILIGSYVNDGIAVGLAFTVLLAIAFSHK